MKLVIAYLHRDRLVCKCDFDCKSSSRCQCRIKILNNGHGLFDEHGTLNHNPKICEACVLNHKEFKSLIRYHMDNFRITKMEYVFDRYVHIPTIYPIIWVPNGIKLKYIQIAQLINGNLNCQNLLNI